MVSDQGLRERVARAHQYQDAVTERLLRAAPTHAKAMEALAILWTIARHLIRPTNECAVIASRLCEIHRTKKQNMAVALKLLEEVGAIRRFKRPHGKVIILTPEKVLPDPRGRLEVIEGGRNGE